MATSSATAQPSQLTPNDGTRPGAHTTDAEVAPQRGRRTTSLSSSDYLDMNISSQPLRIKDESDTQGDEYDEGDNSRVFEARPSLPAPRVEHRSLQDLMDLLNKETVDLNPEYQRDVVWSKERMVGLIDSVIENHYIPPIIFNRQITRNEDGTACVKRVCVDGKQRLSSVKAFMDGTIGCHDRRGSVWYYTPSNNRQSRRTIPEHIKEAFRTRQLIIYEYPNLRRSQEEDLFSRVQKGVQLTNAEKFRATTGPWQDFAKLYERDFSQVSGLSGTKRGVSFNNILTSFGQILEAQHSLANGYPPSFSTQTSTIKALLKNVEDYNTETRDKIRHTYMKFDELIEIDVGTFMNNDYTHARLFSPFEFMATAVLISLNMKNESNQFLLESIRVMRLYLRQCLKDLRMNKASWNCVWPFIESLLPQHEQVPTPTPTDSLVAVRIILAQRLAQLNPAIDPRHIPISGDVDSEAPSTIPMADTSTGASNHLVQTPSKDLRFILFRLEDSQNPGILHSNSHRQEEASSASSPPANMQTQQLETAQPKSTETGPLKHTSTSMVDQPERVPRPEPAGLNRKRKLTRFTTSGSSSKNRERAQPPEANDASTMREPDMRLASSIPTFQRSVDRTTTPPDRKPSDDFPPVAQAQQPRTSVSESVIEISDEECGEAAEDLLAKFKPHSSKRVKVKQEQALDL